MPLLFFLRVNGQRGSGLVSATLVGHVSEHVNALEWGLSELFEIGLWADVPSMQFDFKKTDSYQTGNWTSPWLTNIFSTSGTYFTQINVKYLTKGWSFTLIEVRSESKASSSQLWKVIGSKMYSCTNEKLGPKCIEFRWIHSTYKLLELLVLLTSHWRLFLIKHSHCWLSWTFLVPEFWTQVFSCWCSTWPEQPFCPFSAYGCMAFFFSHVNQ